MSEVHRGCFQNVEMLLKVAIQPMYIAAPMDAIKQQLNSSLFKYNEKMQGIPLSYSDLQFPVGREYGRILIDQPWVHIDVLTKLVVFVPNPGTRTSGKISKISDNHVSILIYAMFNATLSLETLKKEYKYNNKSNTWLSSTGELSEGDTIDFVIDSFQHLDGVIHIEGKLVSK